MTLSLFAIGMFVLFPDPKAPPSLGDKVVEFCKKNMGEKVGDGECAALASEALKSIGAKTRGGPDSPKDGDYVWGKLVFTAEFGAMGLKMDGKPTDVKPGDIVQFRDTKWVSRMGNRTSFQTMEHHTAIIVGVDATAGVYKILHQNVSGKRTVQDGSLPLRDLTSGWIRIYRPEPKN